MRNLLQNRLIGVLPKIGIRPTIDGRRRGVRESLEEQTMAMAKASAKLLTERLRHPSGQPVECILSDTTIGGVAEAAAADQKFDSKGVGLTLTVTPSWCYGAETMDMHPTRPKAIWGFNGTERPGAVYLAAVLAAHAQKGFPAFGIYGKEIQDKGDTSIPEDIAAKLIQFCQSGLALATLKGKSYLSIGGTSMGIAGSIIDPHFLEDYLGLRCEYVDMTEIIRRVEGKIYDREEYEKALSWVKGNITEGPDNNPLHKQSSRQKKDSDWDFCVKMTLILKDLMVGNPVLSELGFKEEAMGHNAIAAGFQGQRQWTDHFPNGDFSETILNSSFDWNGTRQPYILATENDSLNGISMVLGHLLTATSQIFADVRTFWSPQSVNRVTGYRLSGKSKNGIIHLINSGSAALDGTGQQELKGKPIIKPFWDITQDEVKNMLSNSLFRPANLEYFRGGGFSANFTTKGDMPVTMFRINLIKGLGPVLQIAEGYTVELPQNVNRILSERTDPTWPNTWFAPRLTGKFPFDDPYTIMNYWGVNHAALSYGHIGGQLITLASMFRVPVSMHNVSDDTIFRPCSWYGFGTRDLEGADYRACKNFGPLYRRT